MTVRSVGRRIVQAQNPQTKVSLQNKLSQRNPHVWVQSNVVTANLTLIIIVVQQLRWHEQLCTLHTDVPCERFFPGVVHVWVQSNIVTANLTLIIFVVQQLRWHEQLCTLHTHFPGVVEEAAPAYQTSPRASDDNAGRLCGCLSRSSIWSSQSKRLAPLIVALTFGACRVWATPVAKAAASTTAAVMAFTRDPWSAGLWCGLAYLIYEGSTAEPRRFLESDMAWRWAKEGS